MAKRLILTADFLATSLNRQTTLLNYSYSMFRNILRIATGLEPEIFFPINRKEINDPDWQYSSIVRSLPSSFSRSISQILSNPGHDFSRQFFFELSGLETSKRIDHVYDFNFADIKAPSLAYLSNFFQPGDIVIGEELSQGFRDCLSAIGVEWIGFWMHPVRFLDDLLYAFDSSNSASYKAMACYNIGEDTFRVYADYLKMRLPFEKYGIRMRKFEDGAALFFAQMLNDISLFKDGKMLNIMDFEEKLVQLGDEFRTVYYMRHPVLPQKRDAHILDWLSKFTFVKIIQNGSTYHFLASGKFRKATSISSSVLMEARYFDMETEYYYKPVFEYGTEFGKQMLSIFQSHLHPDFWANALEPFLAVKRHPDLKVPSGPNLLRDALGQYWGYKYVDPLKAAMEQKKI